MKRLFATALVLAASQSAFSAVVASQMSCHDLRAVVTAGEREVIGKNGRVYNLTSECGSNFIFQSATGLCSVTVPGTNPDCHQYDNGNGNGGNGGGN